MARPDERTLRAWSALLVAHRRLTTAMDHELQAGASMSLDEYDVLYQLERAGTPVRMSALAQQVLITRPTVTRLVARLVDEGLVERSDDDDDRRAVLVSLSEEGRRRLARAAAVHGDGIARMVGEELAGAQLDQLAAALESITPTGP